MTGVNHLVGGVVYTGVFCSFSDINIFEKPWYLVATMFFSLLADIDHKQGIIGRTFSFTKIPQFIERRYGHRTITHSLIFYLGLGVFVYLLELLLPVLKGITTIYFLAYSSHLIFDMMTVSGVPLLFPFKKNPCVLPANPDYRLRVKDLKSESVVFTIFLGIGLFCYPLMTQGFWTTYNKSFGTLDHLHREYSKSTDIINVDYDYLSHGENHTGEGRLVFCEKSKAYLFTKENEVLKLGDDETIKAVIPTHTGILRKELEYFFYDISADSLSQLFRDKVILLGEFQSNKKVAYFNDKEYKESNVIKLEYAYNPSFEIREDTTHSNERKQLEIKLIELKEKMRSSEREKIEFKAICKELKELNSTYHSLTLSKQESVLNRLKSLRSKKENYSFSGETTEKIEKQIEQLLEEINSHENIYFTGKLVVLNEL